MSFFVFSHRRAGQLQSIASYDPCDGKFLEFITLGSNSVVVCLEASELFSEVLLSNGRRIWISNRWFQDNYVPHLVEIR